MTRTRIAVLADTHIPRRAKQLPPLVLQTASTVDLIIHLGDFNTLEVAEQLGALAPLYAVHGNNDSVEVRGAYPARQQLSVHGHRLVLIHAHADGRTALAAARSVTDADVVLFGHSHRAWSSVEDGRILFNPGSPTDRRWAPYRSFGLLEIGESVTASIVPLEWPVDPPGRS